MWLRVLMQGGGMDANDDVWTVERHLEGQPDFAVALYRQFIEAVESIGPFTYAVSKTTITLKGERRGFAGARPWRRGLRGYFDLQREVHDPRIASVAPYTKRLYVHQFRLTTPDELDEDFMGWLNEAYAVGGGAHLR